MSFPFLKKTRTMPSSSPLYLSDADALLEEDEEITPVEVDCMPYMRGKLDNAQVLFQHPFYGRVGPRGSERKDPPKWPRSTDKLCLHCFHGFSSVPVPIPRRFDEDRNLFYVFGIFCSVNCAKAYILEHDRAISATRMFYFSHMCREVFGIRGRVRPAPPRIRLKMFAGDLTIEEFRHKSTRVLTETVILEPPFVPNPLLFKESEPSVDFRRSPRANQKRVLEEEKGGERSPSSGATAFANVRRSAAQKEFQFDNSLFSKFVRERSGIPVPPAAVSSRKRPHEPPRQTEKSEMMEEEPIVEKGPTPMQAETEVADLKAEIVPNARKAEKQGGKKGAKGKKPDSLPNPETPATLGFLSAFVKTRKKTRNQNNNNSNNKKN
mmetsp:Transcript_8774/g.12171  ORF Transcript_8774/g.12171 Transcript_8774/m.12171 type:complete len:379 (+) Transcript_8774:1322-2458(+)